MPEPDREWTHSAFLQRLRETHNLNEPEAAVVAALAELAATRPDLECGYDELDAATTTLTRREMSAALCALELRPAGPVRRVVSKSGRSPVFALRDYLDHFG